MHWALYLDNGSEKIIWQVVGSPGEFEKQQVVGRKPEWTVRHNRSILVATLNNAADVAAMKEVIRNAEVDNETPLWTCQDYVLEILEKLQEDYIIDEYDEDYEDGVNLAKDRYFGPM